MSHRIEKVNSLLQQEVARLIEELCRDEDSGIISVSGVDTSADLRQAVVWFGVYNTGPGSALSFLKRKKREIEASLYRRLNMKPIPRIVFRYDPSFENAQRITSLLQQIDEEREKL